MLSKIDEVIDESDTLIIGNRGEEFRSTSVGEFETSTGP